MGAVKNGRLAKMGTRPKDLVDTRWVLTWKKVDGAKKVKARTVAKDLRNGNVDIAGCVSRRSSHLRLVSLGALKK